MGSGRTNDEILKYTEKVIQELEDYINQDSPDIKINLSKAFEEWEFNIGFNSEIYACEEEFNDAEAYYDL